MLTILSLAMFNLPGFFFHKFRYFYQHIYVWLPSRDKGISHGILNSSVKSLKLIYYLGVSSRVHTIFTTHTLKIKRI